MNWSKDSIEIINGFLDVPSPLSFSSKGIQLEDAFNLNLLDLYIYDGIFFQRIRSEPLFREFRLQKELDCSVDNENTK